MVGAVTTVLWVLLLFFGTAVSAYAICYAEGLTRFQRVVMLNTILALVFAAVPFVVSNLLPAVITILVLTGSPL